MAEKVIKFTCGQDQKHFIKPIQPASKYQKCQEDKRIVFADKTDLI